MCRMASSIFIIKAINSAANHGIKLIQGTPIDGDGDCAFSSVKQNINDRNCYKEKLPMSVAYYRRIWATDMMNNRQGINSDWTKTL